MAYYAHSEEEVVDGEAGAGKRDAGGFGSSLVLYRNRADCH